MNETPAPAHPSFPASRLPDKVCLWAAVLLAGLVALLRVALARKLSFCGTPDACFYLGMAQSLSSGHGFHAQFLYDFQQAHPTLPNTGLEYWRPGVSFVLQMLRPFGGITLHNSIALTTLVGIVFAAAAWHVAVHTYADRRWALGSFALCLLSSPAWVGSASPDSGLYYGAAVAWFLALFTVRRQGLFQDLLALLCVFFAYLVRNDAALLLVPLLAVLWARHRNARRTADPRNDSGTSLMYAFAMTMGFCFALLPMHVLYKAVLGTAFPSGTAQVLYLNDLSDFGRYHDPVSLHRLLGYGIKHLILFRVSTFATVVYRIAVLMIGYPSLVFLPALFLRDGAAFRRGAQRRLPEFLGAGTFGVAALLAYTLAMPAIGGFSALRTAVGLMPLESVLVVVAIVWTARTPRLAVWLTGGVVAANAVAGVMEMRRDLPAANTIGAADRAEAAQLAALGADPAHAVVLTGDPVQFSVTTGYPTLALPSNGLDAIVAAARDFHATHVILDSENLPASSFELQRQLQPVRSVRLPREHSLILQLPQTATTP